MLTVRTIKLIESLYEERDQESIKEILSEECSRSKLGISHWSDRAIERIWFAVLKIGDGEVDRFLRAVDLAKTDWRDLLMDAGFGHDVDEHEKWWRTIAR